MELYKDGICHSCLSKSINNYHQRDDKRHKTTKLSHKMQLIFNRKYDNMGLKLCGKMQEKNRGCFGKQFDISKTLFYFAYVRFDAMHE